ncbi:MAG: T9SS type A sorting domain-containing protein [Bacteroidota bacterium]
MKKNYSKKIKQIQLFIACILCSIAAKAQVPVVKFSADKLLMEVYDGTSLRDSSSNTPTQWEWNIYDSVTYKDDPIEPISDIATGYVSFDNATNQYSKTPHVSFYRNGKYSVAMRCRNATGWSAWLTKKDYIIVTQPTNYYLGYGAYGPNSDNIVETDYGTIFDDGGANGKYGNNQGSSTRSFLLIKPCNATEITLTMSQLKFADNQDVLYAYDSDHADATKLLQAWTNGNTSTKTVTAYSGTMYLLFKSNGSGIDSGFIGTYTSVLDTATSGISIGIDGDTLLYNSVPFIYKSTNNGFPGVPIIKWTIDGSDDYYTNKPLRNTIYTDGTYEICVQYSGCNILRKVCKFPTVITPTTATNINFKSSKTPFNNTDTVWLTPLTDKASRFTWTISPTSYVLLNPPSIPSKYSPGKIEYKALRGDSLPVPQIWLLDTVCYSVTLTAYNDRDSVSSWASLTKTNYICGKDFRKTYGLYGRVFLDQNSDCQLGSSENTIKDIPIKLYDSSNNLLSITYTMSNGMYVFDKTKGKYKVVLNISRHPLVAPCATGIDSTITLDTSSTFNGCDFATQCGKKDNGFRSIFTQGIVFPGRNHYLRINGGLLEGVTVTGCGDDVDSGTIKITVTGKLKYIGTPSNSISPTSISGNTYTYKIADFNQAKNDMWLTFRTDTNATSSDTIKVEAEVNPFIKDNDTTNNRVKYEYLVRNSYDPNMKEVYPINVKPGYKDWFVYTIHFQNTGTAPAFNIRLEDTLDNQLDLETFEVMEYSHQARIALNKNMLKFYFDDIMLPDSFSDSKGSNGFVQYRIKPKTGYGTGTVLRNTAYIFFDYNSPVKTNTTLNEYVSPTTAVEAIVKNDLFTVYPNPSHGVFNIHFNATITANLKVYNATGAYIGSYANFSKDGVIDLSDYANGIYFIKMEYQGHFYFAKLIKE